MKSTTILNTQIVAIVKQLLLVCSLGQGCMLHCSSSSVRPEHLLMTSIDSVARLSLQNLVLSLEPPPQLSEQLPHSDQFDQSMMTVSEEAEDAVKT